MGSPEPPVPYGDPHRAPRPHTPRGPSCFAGPVRVAAVPRGPARCVLGGPLPAGATPLRAPRSITRPRGVLFGGDRPSGGSTGGFGVPAGGAGRRTRGGWGEEGTGTPMGPYGTPIGPYGTLWDPIGHGGGRGSGLWAWLRPRGRGQSRWAGSRLATPPPALGPPSRHRPPRPRPRGAR